MLVQDVAVSINVTNMKSRLNAFKKVVTAGISMHDIAMDKIKAHNNGVRGKTTFSASFFSSLYLHIFSS